VLFDQISGSKRSAFELVPSALLMGFAPRWIPVHFRAHYPSDERISCIDITVDFTMTVWSRRRSTSREHRWTFTTYCKESW